ncbi:MAG: CinA family protein [Opitutus sp.]|nr:CinA family protein [Opitutus sp.]
MSGKRVKARKPTTAEIKELLLREPRQTLAVAESLTCGHVQAQVGAISGASDFFLGGVTAYSLEQKVKLLGVNRPAAKKVNCVSVRVAEEMACGACGLFGADWAIATTGYAEPSLADGVREPFAWWAIAGRGEGGWAVAVRHGRVACPGAKRGEAQARVAAAVIGALVAYLRERAGRG